MFTYVNCESASGRFHPGEGPSIEAFFVIVKGSFEALLNNAGLLVPGEPKLP